MDSYTYNGNKHLLIIDELVGYIWVKKNVNMQFIYKKVREFLLQFDSSKKLITDNGRELMNENMQEICTKFNITPIPISVSLLNAVYNYNHAVHSTTQRTPIALLYGIQNRNPID